jgi:hypothetical protein
MVVVVSLLLPVVPATVDDDTSNRSRRICGIVNSNARIRFSHKSLGVSSNTRYSSIIHGSVGGSMVVCLLLLLRRDDDGGGGCFCCFECGVVVVVVVVVVGAGDWVTDDDDTLVVAAAAAVCVVVVVEVVDIVGRGRCKRGLPIFVLFVLLLLLLVEVLLLLVIPVVADRPVGVFGCMITIYIYGMNILL